MKVDVIKIMEQLGETKNYQQALDIVQNAWPEKPDQDVIAITDILLDLVA